MVNKNDENSFYPKDSIDTMYIDCSWRDTGPSLAVIFDEAQEKWPGITLDQLIAIPEKIHTRHIAYDLYDPSDYDMFIRVQCTSEYLEKVTAPALAA